MNRRKSLFLFVLLSLFSVLATAQTDPLSVQSISEQIVPAWGTTSESVYVLPAWNMQLLFGGTSGEFDVTFYRTPSNVTHFIGGLSLPAGGEIRAIELQVATQRLSEICRSA